MAARLLDIGVALAAACLSASAQAQTPAVPAPPSVTAVRVDARPVIDGRLDDPAWRGAARIGRFVQQKPVEGAPASEQTDVYVAYDSEHLYFGIHAHYTDTTLVRANRSDRDQTTNDDTVSVSFDPFLDQQRGYSFSVNAYGVQADSLLAGGTNATTDTSWNVLYESSGALVEDGWTAEMAVPIKSLRYPSRSPGQPHHWGFQVQREIRGKDETVSWSPVSSDIMGTLAQMGVLEGMRDLSTRRNLEILPTVTAIQTRRLDAAGLGLSDDVAEAGVNVKYGLSSNITLDATYNPDFSQIESDRPQIEINQRFPLFVAELRPFFLEGQEIFKVGGAFTFLHTRTILDPKYGVKLTGKSGRTTFALLAANDEAAGRAGDPSTPGWGESAKLVAGRVKYDLGTESFAAVLLTDREFAATHSRVGVYDGTYRIGKNHRLQTTFGFSDHRDGAGVQRNGHALDVGLLKQGRNLSYGTGGNFVSPDYRNDAGFISRVDYRRTIGYAGYRWWPEGRVVNWGPKFTYDQFMDYDGVLTDRVSTLNLQGTFANNISVTSNLIRQMERYRNQDFDKTRFFLQATINTNRRILFKGDVGMGDEIRFIASPFLGRTSVYNATVTLRPSSRFQSEITLNTTRFTDVRTGVVDFDVKIYRALTTYQFTERLLIRNIVEGNTLARTLGLNLLGTYRVNAGTVFFVGYDDRYREADMISSRFTTDEYTRTNRAVFTKLQYLYRR